MPRGESARNVYNTQSRDTRSSGMNVRGGTGNPGGTSGAPSFDRSH